MAGSSGCGVQVVVGNISPYSEGEVTRPAFTVALSSPLSAGVVFSIQAAGNPAVVVDTPTLTFNSGVVGPLNVNLHPVDNQTRNGDETVPVYISYNTGDACLSGYSQTVDVTIRDNERYTFVTDATAEGNYAMTGVAELRWDDFCRDNAGNRPNATWRAVIGTGNRISPVPSGTGSNWPLKRQHNYLLARVNGNIGGTAFVTDANALPSFSPTFALLDSGQTATDVWLGFTNTWQNSFENCTNWTVGGSTGTMGNPAAMNQGTFFGPGAVSCSTPASIWCVEE